MKIREAASRAQLSAKTIRYYEQSGLIAPAPRADNGYRNYGDKDVHTLRFIQRARSLGFSIDDCRELLSLYGDSQRSSADVKAIAENRLLDIERKIAELESLRIALAELINRCHGDDRPDCPILDDLSSGMAEGLAES